MFPSFHPFLSFAGRFLLSVIFLLSGIHKLMDWSGTADYMAFHGMTAVPFFLTAAIVVELVGGVALLFGYHTRFAALILFLYLIPVTYIFHHFWGLQGQAQQEQLINFLKNLAIMGGLLEFCAVGAGLLSMDTKLGRTRFGWLRPWRRW